MSDPRVAIVNYGMGNLFSVKNACENSGMEGLITSSVDDINSADAVILPGVGAFGDAMKNIRRLGLVEALKEAALSKPFMGICLGMQLLMSESFEFGHHEGLGIINGKTVRFNRPVNDIETQLKVPHVGWNQIYKANKDLSNKPFEELLLKGIKNGEFMYFVHSYYVIPENHGMCLTMSGYGDIEFCSSIHYRNIHAFQFHPERSGPCGLIVYKNFASSIKKCRKIMF
ncbi:MAG: imidazole glycerol phosphate synthase subunit HisH [Candidatus Omnitrophota bacterium]